MKVNKDTGEMTGYNNWPAGFTKSTTAFYSSLFDGTHVWLIPFNADRVIKVNKNTGEMTGYNEWPSGFTKGNSAFVGTVFDGQNIWLIPQTADRVIKIDKDTGVMTGYNSWPAGFTKGSGAFAGGVYDGENIWLIPYNADRVIKFNTTTGVMTGYNSWPTGFTKPSSAFIGGVLEGDHIWLIPSTADRLIRVNKNTGAMTGHNNWPTGFIKNGSAFFGGVYDGQYIWLIPSNADRAVRVNKDTFEMTSYMDWPSNFSKGTAAFIGGVYDGANIWMVPSNSNQLMKLGASSVSSNNNLSILALSSGVLNSVFASSTTDYTANVPNSTNSISIIPTASDCKSTVKVNGTTVTSGQASGAIELSVGSNTISTVVTAENGATKTYTVQVTREAASNADLSGMTLSAGALSPTFASGTTSYTASVANNVTSLTVTPTASDSTATVAVNGATVTSGQASGAIALSVGSNTISTVVTAQSGATKTYTVQVTREAASNADLSGMTLSAGALSPTFASGTTSYTASVANNVTSLTVTPTASDSIATVKVNGATVTSGQASGAIALSVGSNTISTVVTAQSGATKTYTVTVTREAASNADLSGMTLSAGALSPTFASGTTSYTANVSNNVYSLTVTPTVSDSTATVTVNGTTVTSGQASGAVALSVGSNTISTVVTAQSGATKTYTVTVTREAASNADLSGMTLSAGTLSPTFVSGTTSYTANVSNNVYSLTVTPTVSDSTATVTVNGTTVTSGQASGAVALSVGSNTISTVVTAENGATKTYTVTVTRDQIPNPGAPLAKLESVGDGKVTLSWEPVASSTGYKIFRSETSGTYGSELSTVNESVYSYESSGLQNGVTYYFVIRAVNAGGDSAVSNEVSAMPITVPGQPTNISAALSDRVATITFTAPVNDGGSSITSYEVTSSEGGVAVTDTSSPIKIKDLAYGTRYTFTVRAVNQAGKSAPSAESNAVIPMAPESDSSPAAPENRETAVQVIVNGKLEEAGTLTTSVVNDQVVTTIRVDQGKLESKLAAEGQRTVVTIPVSGKADVVVGELSGQMVKIMESKEAVLEIKTDRATYTLPAEQVNIDSISRQLGRLIALQNIRVQIEVAAPTPAVQRLVENAAAKESFTLVAPPISFKVKAVSEGTTVEVSTFNAYVERTIAIPEGVGADKITTGVVVEPDGTVRHVPTKIVQVDGKWYAQINSLTNSTYSVIWKPLQFKDASNHWAEKAINNMASRMVVEGTGDSLFTPDREITRAEFISIVVRGLGLRVTKGNISYKDVNITDWYYNTVSTAAEYSLISGYEDGTFRPNDKITREQAMVIVAEAMKLTRLSAKPPTNDLLQSYVDSAEVSDWAKRSVEQNLLAALINGRSDQMLAPGAYMTRAEMATIIQKLLVRSGLI